MPSDDLLGMSAHFYTRNGGWGGIAPGGPIGGLRRAPIRDLAEDHLRPAAALGGARLRDPGRQPRGSTRWDQHLATRDQAASKRRAITRKDITY